MAGRILGGVTRPRRGQVIDNYNHSYGGGYGNSGMAQQGVEWQQCVGDHDSRDDNEDDKN
jgi:hypothetical protein